MANFNSCTIVFIYVFLSVLRIGMLELSLDLPKCCQNGINWGKEGFKCLNYQRPIVGVPESDQDECFSMVQLCCEKTQNDMECEEGLKIFKESNYCPARGDESCGDTGRRCCETCRMGKVLGTGKAVCSSVNVEIDEDLKKVFRRCCEEENPPPPKSQEPAKNRSKSDSQAESKDDTDEYDSYDTYGIPTPVTDSLCDLMPGILCAHICVPTPGSYYCKCRDGFVLMEDQKTCQQEKARPKPATIAPPVIVPNPEKPVPLHKPRQVLDRGRPFANKTCNDYNPCQQECVNTGYGIKCSCYKGYEIDADRKSCNDIDECLDRTHMCHPQLEKCINLPGHYRCVLDGFSQQQNKTPFLTANRNSENCLPGFERNSSASDECVDIDECDYDSHPEVCEPEKECVNLQGGYECRCKAGFREDPDTKSCADINECQTNAHNCLATQRCDNTLGSFQCIRFTGCGTGYTLNSQTGICEDDDECALKLDNCQQLGPLFQCRNTPGSFRCERIICPSGDRTCNEKLCRPGYEQNESGDCVDIDECKTRKHNCIHNQEICINLDGSYTCKLILVCPPGYEATAIGCIDVDECATKKHTCKGLAKCKNEIGSFTCECPPGYQTDDTSSCEDINECNLYLCPYNSECMNIPGSYRCICKNGFKNVGINTCQDVDECTSQPGICEHNCINVFGSFRCTCKTGFKLHENNRTCVDLNECEMFKDQKLCIGECVNTPGSYSCTCPPGYVLGTDGRTCQDVDECIRNPCTGEDEVCLNTRGNYRCNSIKCPPDYVKDAEHKNRCRRLKTYCRQNDMRCLQRPVTYSFNFLTFVSMLPIPPSGHLDLFTMRGPLLPASEAQFTLELLSARAPPNIPPSTKDFFRLRMQEWNQAVISLVRPIPGPQELELQLTMKMYHNGIFGGTGVAKLFIHVSEFEF